ncbi:MAG: 6-phosphofructokinase [bacterium]|nr:6-phosphofructokinase [bacterium]
MTDSPRRIGILTGGGDCPGLNAVIRAVTKDAIYNGIEVIGIEDGFLGLIEERLRPLTYPDVSDILTTGGTILGSSNKANPARFATGTDASGRPIFEDVSPRCLEVAKSAGLEALVVVGGDGTMMCAQPFVAAGLSCIGVPKTIDNDIVGTELSFGFLTASHVATEALDRVHTTADSHGRVLVVEVMGRNAGWIALHSGVAGGADVILLPEIPFDMDAVCEKIARRRARGKRSTVICAAEGARPKDGTQIVRTVDPSSPDPIKLGGIAAFVAAEVEARTDVEARHVVLGHTQRGGSPVPADRVVATMFGDGAIELVKAGKRNRMVAMQAGRLTDIAIEESMGGQRLVALDHPLIAAARSVYTSFGDE